MFSEDIIAWITTFLWLKILLILSFEEIMHTQIIVVFVSGFLALLGIRILISSFDDNDGDGMAYSTRDNYQFSILKGSWHLISSREISSSVTCWCHTWPHVLLVVANIASSFFSLKSLIAFQVLLLGPSFISFPISKVCKPNPTESLHSLTMYLSLYHSSISAWHLLLR